MSIKILRDLTDELNQLVDSANVFAFMPTPNGKHQYVVAAGAPANQIYSGIRPLAWLADSNGCQETDNTADDWASWFDSEAEAEEYIETVRKTVAC